MYGPALQPNASAINVLLNIIRQGFLRAGWSFRKKRATIYGPHPVVCFTEMPFDEVVDHARSRAYDRLITPYGVALLRDELFEVGGRPVIYGLSGGHRESREGEIPMWQRGFRCLVEDCGIGLHEQYRYVATRLNGTSPIDWMQEREWRWALAQPDERIPGLPLWLLHSNQAFSQIGVFVKTSHEVACVMDQLNLLYDSNSNKLGSPVDKRSMLNTRVISVEEISTIPNLQTIPFEDLPFRRLERTLELSAATIENVKQTRGNEVRKRISSRALQLELGFMPQTNNLLASGANG